MAWSVIIVACMPLPTPPHSPHTHVHCVAESGAMPPTHTPYTRTHTAPTPTPFPTHTQVHGVAKNDAVLEGLLCIFHVAHAGGAARADECELPLLSDWDKEMIKCLGAEFDIDYISLSYCRSPEDVLECRA